MAISEYFPNPINPEEWLKLTADISAEKIEEFGELIDVYGSVINVKLKDKNQTISLEKIIEVSKLIFDSLSIDNQRQLKRSLGKMTTKFSEHFDDLKMKGISLELSKKRQFDKFQDEVEEGFSVKRETKAVDFSDLSTEQQLARLAEVFNEDTPVEAIITAASNDINQLFVSLEGYDSFLVQTIQKFRDNSDLKNPIVNLFSEIIKRIESVGIENRIKLVDLLFKSTVPTFFELLMQTEEKNTLYDLLIINNILTDHLLNADSQMRKLVVAAAFTPARYDTFWVSRSDLTPEQLGESERISHYFSAPERNAAYQQSRKSPRFGSWIEKRMAISSTLTKDSTIKNQACRQWLAAEQTIHDLAVAHQESHATISLADLCQIHELVMRGEIDAIGRIRRDQEYVYSSGGAFVPPHYLKHNLDSFFEWFQQQCELCDRGEGNPVLFAFEASQRFVSYHPFPNGNGRISGLLMDYVLQRYSIAPPPVDFLTPVFPMKAAKFDYAQQYDKYLNGLNRSIADLKL